jgi:lipopolysaccharide assembly protein A
VRIISLIFLVAIILLGISFATLNSEPVTFNYYVGQKTMPLSLLLVSIFALGSLMGLAVGLWLLIKAKLRFYNLKGQLKFAQQEINNLRAIPLQDKH